MDPLVELEPTPRSVVSGWFVLDVVLAELPEFPVETALQRTQRIKVIWSVVPDLEVQEERSERLDLRLPVGAEVRAVVGSVREEVHSMEVPVQFNVHPRGRLPLEERPEVLVPPELQASPV